MIEKSFTIELPYEEDVEKAGSDESHVFIKGIACTDDIDRVGEQILVKNVDISILDGNGVINYDHRKEPGAVLGEITKAWKEPSGDNPNRIMVEGMIYTSKKEGRDIVELMRAMKKAGSSRKLGMSIEGKIVARDNHRIVKALAHSVALSMLPVNTKCIVLSYGNDMAKSLEAGFCTNPTEELCKACDEGQACGIGEHGGKGCGCKGVCEPCASKADEKPVEKTLEAGYGDSPATQTDGGALRQESLEGGKEYVCKKCQKKHKPGLHDVVDSDVQKSLLTKDEAIAYVKAKKPNWPDTFIERFVEVAKVKAGKRND